MTYRNIRNVDRRTLSKSVLDNQSSANGLNGLTLLNSTRYNSERAGMAELADAKDLKSFVRKNVWVRDPLPAPLISEYGCFNDTPRLLDRHLPDCLFLR